MAIQIGKYKRPGIFVEEFDNSVISAAPTVAGSTSLVIGFSKKGPINTPITVSNITDFERIFGPLDRNMERKGSFFHRTVSKLLETNSVAAMNLLATSDTLDLLEYKSVSTRTDKQNDIIREGAYRRFFNTTGFWSRDTDSFLTLISGDAGAADRLLSFTNMSDKYITVFVFKSKMTGFDRAIVEYYGTTDRVPDYLNALDYASDYMVDVMVVAGDWSNYSQLAVDTRWSQYFNSEGLLKTAYRDFANDRNVNLLAFYEGLSLIPFFRDNQGRNIFIETVINSQTDRTGLFCAFDADKFELSYPNGMIDLLGNNLVGANDLIDTDQSTFNFLSYEATIQENISYESTPLDAAGGELGQNVVALGPNLTNVRGTWGGVNRTALFAEEFINGVNYATYAHSITGTNSIALAYELANPVLGGLTSSNAYCVIGGEKILINGGAAAIFTYSIPSSLYTVSSTTASYTSVVHIDSTGTINLTNGTTDGTLPTIPSADLVLTFVNLKVKNGLIIQATGSTPTLTNVGVDASDFNDLVMFTDYEVYEVATGVIRVEFYDTAAIDVTRNYKRHRKIRLFNFLVSMLDSPNISKMTMLKDLTTYEKFSLANATISNIVTAVTSNKSFDLDLGLGSTPADILAGNLVFYKLDNEFVLGTNGVNTRQTIATASYGIVARYSDFYTNFNDGQINTGDYFYDNLTDQSNSLRVVFQNEGTQSYIVFDQTPWAGFLGNEQILVPDSTLNKGVITIDGDTNFRTSLVDPETGAIYAAGYEAYKVTNTLVDEDLSGVRQIYDSTTKVYLKMYIDSSENLQVTFRDSLLSSFEPIDTSLNINFRVVTNDSNYKQTVEIEVPANYTESVNKILVKGSRYTEVKVGDFLEAYVDPDVTLAAGEVPRKLTRILSKRLYSADTSLVEITCDSAIAKYQISTGTGYEYQTTRYTTIDDYVSVYKAIPLKGFRVREASMPDGTETRQTSILNLVAKGTPLFKALTNKEAIDFRYVVDSFGLGLTERSKQQLVDICGERLDCLGFINMPSIKSFKNSTSPTFVDADGVLQTSFIATGGDPESSPAFLYSFGDGRGASSVGYFLPYVTVNDNGRPAEVPPAPYVATTYLRKRGGATTNLTPWTIAAGITNGRVTNIAGIEMNFTPSDIENLNGAQMNPIVFKRNRGFVIETENTAQTLYRSALSYLHVREVLIELERELSAMLLEFQWRFNTAEVRAEIKLRADVICETYVNRNGLFNYFNKCDDENNTTEIIDNQIGVLDTFVEPIKGMGVIVNNITILRTGAISAGGFINQ